MEIFSLPQFLSLFLKTRIIWRIFEKFSQLPNCLWISKKLVFKRFLKYFALFNFLLHFMTWTRYMNFFFSSASFNSFVDKIFGWKNCLGMKWSNDILSSETFKARFKNTKIKLLRNQAHLPIMTKSLYPMLRESSILSFQQVEFPTSYTFTQSSEI